MKPSVAPALYARTAAATSAIEGSPTAGVLAVLSFVFLLLVEGQLVFQRGMSWLEIAVWGVFVVLSMLAAWILIPAVIRVFREPASLLVLATLLTLAGWFVFVGIPLAYRDVVVFALAGVAGHRANRALKRRYPTQARFARRFAALTAFWVLSSLGIAVMDSGIGLLLPRLFAQPADGADTFATPGGAAAPTADTAREAVLALSGGGYRAALFHAGVLDGLATLGVRPTALSTVSGGSIIGAYYAAGRTPRSFVSAVSRGDFRLAHALVYPWNVGRMIGNLRLFPSQLLLVPGLPDFSRTHVEANILDRAFLGSVPHREFGNDSGARHVPLMLCLSDLRGGRAIGVTPGGAVVQMIAPSISRFHFANADTAAPEPEFRLGRPEAPGRRDANDERTALLVAASGAFPGAFKPLPLALPPDSGGASASDSALVADGGILDNSGVVLAYAANRRARSAPDSASARALRPWLTGLIIASDGSALDVPTTPTTLPAELSRTIDVLYRSTSGEALTVSHPHPRTVSVSVTVLAQTLGRAPGRTRVQKRADHARWVDLVDRLRPGDLEVILGLDPPGVTSSEERATLDAWGRAEAATGVGTPPPPVLRLAVRKRVLAALGVFVRTPTLKDQMSLAHAKALYRLGRYSVILFGREIRDGSQEPEPVG